MPGMTARIKLKKGRALVGHENAAPVVTITAFDATPPNGTASTVFSATALDAEQGDLSANIVWTSSGEAGVLGIGASVTLTFVVAGGQTVTATATDAFGTDGTDTQAVTVDA